MTTRVTVRFDDRLDRWVVRADGAPAGDFPTRKEATQAARELAREAAPHARCEVQSKRTGAWKTLVTL